MHAVRSQDKRLQFAGYESLFEEPYPLDKLDLIGVPDFAYGAMENWGIITYRETSLLVPDASNTTGDVAPGGPSIQQLYLVPLTVAHELAHMWFGVQRPAWAVRGPAGCYVRPRACAVCARAFQRQLECHAASLGRRALLRHASGRSSLCAYARLRAKSCAHPCMETREKSVNAAAGDLVTLPWWTQLWLNEGFATYLEQIGAAAYWNGAAATKGPPGSINYMHDFNENVLDVALNFDAGTSSYALAVADSGVMDEVRLPSETLSLKPRPHM
jgi:Peptidase family M1 domain